RAAALPRVPRGSGPPPAPARPDPPTWPRRRVPDRPAAVHGPPDRLARHPSSGEPIRAGRGRSFEAGADVPPAVAAAEAAPQVVDLTSVIRVVGDHRGDDPAGRTQLAPIGGTQPIQLVIVGEQRDIGRELVMSTFEPSQDLTMRCLPLDPRFDGRRGESEGAA